MVRAAQVFNGITIAYMMAGVQTVYSLLIVFGVPLSAQREAAISAFLTWAITLGVHIGHRVGEVATTTAVANGSPHEPPPPSTA